MRWALLITVLWALPLQAQLFSPDKLARPHAELEGLKNCTQCHQLGERISEDKCLQCHDALAARIRSDLGYHARLTDKNCIDCHSDHRGIDYEMVRWDTTKFDHDSTGYALTGKHLELNCSQCHQTESYVGLEQDCLSCHQDEHRGQLGKDCTQCHSTKEWPEIRFEHEKAQFQLVGKHQEVDCNKCHLLEDIVSTSESGSQATQDAPMQVRRYKPLPFAECSDCHTDYHQGQFEQDCAACHGESDWKKMDFDHQRAQFALLGKHQQVKCNQCHQLELFADGAQLQRFKPLPFANCADCHADYHQNQFAQDCAECHRVEQWPNTTFDHSRSTFHLDGAHANVKCELCHALETFANGEELRRYKPVDDACQTCHGAL